MGLQSLKPIASRKLTQAGVLITLLATFNFLTLPGLLEQYSFWRDEIFTAAFISDSWGQLFTQWIGPDVHPPLYFILAKAWADQLGTSELSLRSLSYLASTGTIALLWWNWVKNQRLQRLLALVLVTASPTFLYYSQEARSYSFLFLGCCGLFLSIFYKHNLAREKIDLPIHNQQRQYASTLTVYLLCLGVSLIHYFGFILAAWILFIDLFDRKINSNRLQSISAFLLICLWPVFHIGFLGSLGDVQREKLGNLVGTYKPFSGTAEAFIYANFHYVHTGIIILNSVIIGLIALGTYLYLLKPKKPMPVHANLKKSRQDFNYSLLLTLSLVGSISIIDTNWPITTARNFIILLYPSCIIIASVFEYAISNRDFPFGQLRKLAATSAFTFITIISFKISILNIDQKVMHGIDYKSLAQFIGNQSICSEGCISLDYDPRSKAWDGKIDDYYFGDYNLYGLKDSNLNSSEAITNQSLPVISSAYTQPQIQDLLKTKHPDQVLIRSCNLDGSINKKIPFILLPHDKLQKRNKLDSKASQKVLPNCIPRLTKDIDATKNLKP